MKLDMPHVMFNVSAKIRIFWEMEDLVRCINNCDLVELKFIGSLYTWWNERIEEECIFERLDRILVNHNFIQKLLESEVHHLIRRGSDHAPLHVVCIANGDKIIKSSKLLNFWIKHLNFKKVMKDSLEERVEGLPFTILNQKLKRLKGVLVQWSRDTFRNVFRKIATLENIIKEKEVQVELSPSAENRIELSRVNAELKRFLKLEEEV